MNKFISEEKFHQSEFDLPGGYSQFVGLLELDSITIPFFISKLLIGSFAFGLIVPEESVGIFSKEKKGQLLETLYSKIIPDKSDGSIDYFKAITTASNLGLLLLRVTTDGQDNQYLEFYGPPAVVETKINNALLPRLEKHFYIRRRQPGLF